MTGRIFIRPADAPDAEPLWRWRNDPATRQFAFSQEAVDWDKHQNWFAAALDNPDRTILVACDTDGQRLGMVRFDMDEKTGQALTSINLAPSARGKQLSVPILSAAIEYFLGPRKLELIAEIKPDNTASLKCFQSCGFAETHISTDRLMFARPANFTPIDGP